MRACYAILMQACPFQLFEAYHREKAFAMTAITASSGVEYRPFPSPKLSVRSSCTPEILGH